MHRMYVSMHPSMHACGIVFIALHFSLKLGIRSARNLYVCMYVCIDVFGESLCGAVSFSLHHFALRTCGWRFRGFEVREIKVSRDVRDEGLHACTDNISGSDKTYDMYRVLCANVIFRILRNKRVR